MIITLPWLKEHLQTKANQKEIIEKLTKKKNGKNNFVILSDSNYLKNYIETRLSEFENRVCIMHLESNHMQSKTNPTKNLDKIKISNSNLLHTALDIKLISLAKKCRSFSVYPWGSGFITWVSKIYGVPFKCERIKLKK